MPQLEIIKEIGPARNWVREQRAAGAKVGLVPTMGALHEGHLSLMRRARSGCDRVVASIFVNPTQFGPGEDLERYPRDLDRDAQLAESVGIDLIFAPEPEDMYPEGSCTHVEVEGLTDRLCGQHRPEHFRGVTTVVAKLFNILPVQVVYFGHKDFQQAVVVQRMVRDLHFDIEIHLCPTVREADGLAMSSRNAYLSIRERFQALCLSKALNRARDLFEAGQRDVEVLKREMRNTVKRVAPDAKIDYAEVVEPENLHVPEEADERSVALVAVRIGETRLIDNMPLGMESITFQT